MVERQQSEQFSFSILRKSTYVIVTAICALGAASCGSSGSAADAGADADADAKILNTDANVVSEVTLPDAPSLDAAAPTLGAIFVTAVDSSGRPVADVAVSADPDTLSATTDALGSVLLRDIPAGFYSVTGVHPTQGTARGAVSVSSGQISSVNLSLRKTTAPGGAPAVTITSPTSGATYAANTTITVRAQVSDDRDAPETLALRWSSNIDGILGTKPALTTGQATLTTALSIGSHVVTLTVTDSGGLSSSASISVIVRSPVDGGNGDGDGDSDGGGGGSDDAMSVVVALAAPTKDSNGINLSWSATPDTTVTSYRIYRSGSAGGFEVIDLVSDPKTVTFRDDKIQLGVTYSYRVSAILGPGREVQSNVQMITSGVYIALDTQVTAMMVDKKRPYLYAIDSVNNGLLFVNLTSNTVDKTIFAGSRPQDLDINQAGTELYIADFGATQITVVNLATQAVARTLTVDTSLGTWDGNPYRLACMAGDTLVFTSLDQWNDLKLVNAITGANLSVAGSIYEPELVASPDGTHLYMGESGLSTVTLQRFDIVAGKLQQADTSGDAGEYGGRALAISGDGKYLFFADKKFLATNLKSMLGTFAEAIILANGDGSVAVGAKNIYDGNTFAVSRATPLQTGVMALSADEATLYLYDTMTSRLYLYKMK